MPQTPVPILDLVAQATGKFTSKGGASSIAVGQANSFLSEIQNKTNANPEQAKEILLGVVANEIARKGDDPKSVIDSYPQELKDTIGYTPEKLKLNQTITKVGTIASPLLFLGAGVAAVLGAPVAVAGAIAALGWAVSSGVNNWNDVFHWGELQTAQLQQDLKKEQETLSDLGITNFGSFKDVEVQAILAAYQRAGRRTFTSPFTGMNVEMNESNFKEALRDIISDMNAQGVTPTKEQVLAVFQGWVNPGKGGATFTITPPADSGSGGSYTAGPVSRATTTQVAKPKLFLGTFFSGRIGKFEAFERQVDDKITSLADMIDDLETNLIRFMVKMPGMLSYDLFTAIDPKDEQGIPKQGSWVVCNVFFTNTMHKRMLIENILLGPVDPAVYYPEYQSLQQVQIQVPQILTPTKLNALSLPTGKEYTIDKQGNVVAGFFGGWSGAGGDAAATSKEASATSKESTAGASAPAPAQTTTTTPSGQTLITPPKGATIYNSDGSQFAVSNGVESYSEAWWKATGKTWKMPAVQATSAPATSAQETNAPTQSGDLPNLVAPFPRTITINKAEAAVRSAPNTSASLAGSQKLVNGDQFQAVGLVVGEEVGGNKYWWLSSKGNYVWSGGTN